MYELFDTIPLVHAMSPYNSGALGMLWFLLFIIAGTCFFVGCYLFMCIALTYKTHPEYVCETAKHGTILIAVGIVMFSLGDNLLYPILVSLALATCWFAWKVLVGITVSFSVCVAEKKYQIA